MHIANSYEIISKTFILKLSQKEDLVHLMTGSC